VVSPEKAARLLESHGAIMRGHFKLSSGRHSDVYVEKARILEQPEATMAVARAMASWYPQVDVVVAPAVGAIVLGFAVALAAGARSIYAEREGDHMRFRRGFLVAPEERALVVEDVVTTGGSAGEICDLIDETGAQRLGVAALVDRTTAPMPFPFRALVRIEASTWDPAECPLCKQGRPFDSPGSRYLERSG
jgi:orotate phosphoribosyltransferase